VNVQQAHIQTAIWKSALDSEPLDLDAAEYGWERDERGKCMISVALLPNIFVAPPEGVGFYGSTKDIPFLTAMCGCLAVKS
jgi:hypothetical protein